MNPRSFFVFLLFEERDDERKVAIAVVLWEAIGEDTKRPKI